MVETVALGEYLFKREPRDRKPHRVQVIMKPKDGVVAVMFSDGTVGAVSIEHLYPTWKADKEVVPLRLKSRKQRGLAKPHEIRAGKRWVCVCGAHNLPSRLCWRCGKEHDE